MLNVRQITVLSAATLMMLSPMQVMAAAKANPQRIKYGTAVPAANRQSDGIEDVIQKARSNKSFELFYQGWQGELMRARMDREVAKIIETDPVARAAYAEVLSQSGPALDKIETQHDDMAQRYAKGYAGGMIFNMVKDDVKSRGMNANDTVVWIMNGEMNAYTFSASRPRVVLLQPLLDAMEKHPEAIQAVIKHEDSHIEFRHVDIGAVVQAVYDTVGRIIIPDEDVSTTFLSVVQSEGRKANMALIDAKGPGAEAFADIQQQRAENVSAKISKEFGNQKEKILQLANKLYRATGGKSDLIDSQGNLLTKKPVSKDDGGKVEHSMEDEKAFKAANTRLTRGMETTADQGSIVNLYKYAFKRAVGTDEDRDKAAREYTVRAFATSMAILQGGRNAQVAPFIKQAYDRLEKAQLTREDMSKVESGDHPATLFRVIEAIRYMNTPEFKIATTPFLKGLNLYGGLVEQIATDSDRMRSRALELPTSELLDHRDIGFVKASKDLEAAIVTEIVNDVKAGNPEKAKLLLKMVDTFDPLLGLDWTSSMSLLSSLRTAMRAQNTDLSNKIADAIDQRAPETPQDQSLKDIDTAADAMKNPKPKVEVAPKSCKALLGDKK